MNTNILYTDGLATGFTPYFFQQFGLQSFLIIQFSLMCIEFSSICNQFPLDQKYQKMTKNEKLTNLFQNFVRN